MLKRKSQWVRRYAMVDGPARMLHYKNTKSDAGWKYSFDLSMAKISQGTSNNMLPYLQIEPDAKEMGYIDIDSQQTSPVKYSDSFVSSKNGKEQVEIKNSFLFSSKSQGKNDTLKIRCDTTN